MINEIADDFKKKQKKTITITKLKRFAKNVLPTYKK